MWCSETPRSGSSTRTQLSNVAAMLEPGYLSELNFSSETLKGTCISGER